MCKYDSSMCPAAERWFTTAMGVNNLKYGLGYDWDSTMPGAAALAISLNLGVSAAAKEYLEGYILQKWEVGVSTLVPVFVAEISTTPDRSCSAYWLKLWLSFKRLAEYLMEAKHCRVLWSP